MRSTLILFLSGLAVLVASPALAQEDPPAGGRRKLEPDPVVEEVDREKAKGMLKSLEVAEKTKDQNKIVAALLPFVEASNESFVKPLDKLTRHRRASVRVVATKALGSQGPVKKVGPILYKILMDRTKMNKGTPQAKAMAISSMRRIKFDNKAVLKELKSEFRKVKYTSLMRECARYFGDLKKVETVKMLVSWVEAPQPANVNSPTNPPASYWKRMWETWEEIKVPVIDALKRITGKDFESKREWEEWTRSREAKRLGV